MEVLVDAMISDPRHPFWKPEPSFIGILRLDGNHMYHMVFKISNRKQKLITFSET
jgi:hypothetical protein